MKRLIFYLIVLCLAVWIGVQIKSDPGYALFAYKHWSMEMPLWLLILALILMVIIIYYLLRFFQGAGLFTGKVHHWVARRKLKRTRTQINKGLIELTEGRWQQAEDYLISSAKGSEIPVINYLAAARAAHELGAYQRRDDYLRQAHAATSQAEVAISLTQAQLQLSHQQYEQALATLQRLRSLMPNHTYVLRLLKTLYENIKDWQSLAELIPDLRKHGILRPNEIETLEFNAYQALLTKAQEQAQLDEIKKLWRLMPKYLRSDPRIIIVYVRALIMKDEHDEAERLLAETIKKVWNNECVYLYGIVKAPNPQKQLSIAENWLKKQPENATCLLTVGRLSLRNHLWGKAKNYLHASIEFEENVETYRELGRLLESLNEKEKAFECYRKGMKLIK